MAGRGPAPKASARRNKTAPMRGDWVDLEDVCTPVLPDLPDSPDERGWTSRVASTWEAWRRDPATTMYGPSEIAAALELAYVMESFVRGDRGSEKSSEVRLRMDGLGLTPKGKRDLRWRSPSERKAEEPARPQMAEVRRLRAVDPQSVAS